MRPCLVAFSLSLLLIFGLIQKSSALEPGSGVDAPFPESVQNLTILSVSDCYQTGAAVITIVWNAPDTSHLLGYEFSLSPSADENSLHCLEPANLTTFINDTEQTNLTVKANSPGLHPLLGCSYVLALKSVPANAMETINFRTASLEADPTYNPTCRTQIDSNQGTYNTNVEWSTNANDCGFLAAIDHFSVLLYQDSQLDSSDTSTTHKLVGEMILPFSWDPESHNHAVSFSSLRPLFMGSYNISIVTIMKTTAIFSDNISTLACSFAAPPLPPSPVTTIRVIRYIQIDGGANFSITWLPPLVTNGILTKYELWIGIESVFANQEESTLNNSLWQDTQVITDAFSPYADGEFAIPDGKRAVFQIRVANEDCQNLPATYPCYSSWSPPLLLNNTQCYPASSSNPAHQYSFFEAEAPSTDEQEVLIRGRCFTSCTDETSSTNKQTNESLSDCTFTSRVKECYRGCVTRSHFSSLPMLQCTDTCYSACRNECAGSAVCSVNGGECQQECRVVSCWRGCQQYDAIISTNYAKANITEPTGLILQPTFVEGGGEYSIVVTSGRDSGSVSDNVLTEVTLVRIEIDGSDSQYLWRPYQEEPQKIDFAYANCKRVNVSASLVNQVGRSNYGNRLSAIVYGELRYPEQVQEEDVDFFIDEDFRKGFFEHAVVSMTWNRSKGFEYLQFYQVRIFSPNDRCGGNKQTYHYDVDKEATSFIFQSEFSSQPPVFNCFYTIRIFSYPVRPGEIADRISLDTNYVDTPSPELDAQCYFSTNTRSGLIEVSIDWELIPNDPIALEAIQQFVMFPAFVVGPDPNSFGSFIFSSLATIPKQVGQYSYSHAFEVEPVSSTAAQDTLRLQLSSPKNTTVYWRKSPSVYTCFRNALPFPPSTISPMSIKTEVLIFTDTNISISVRWSEPEYPYGGITDYEVVLTSIPLAELDNPFLDSAPGTVLAQSQINMTTLSTTNRFPPSVKDLFIQVRASNNRATGNWSDPYVLYYMYNEPAPSPSVSSIPPLLTTSETRAFAVESSAVATPSSLTLNITSELLFIIPIAAAAGFLLLCVIFTVITCVAAISFRRRKIKKQFELPLGEMWKAHKRGQSTHSAEYGYRPDQWELHPRDIIVGELMSEGFFGEVYKGAVKGPLKSNTQLDPTLRNELTLPVAIKYLKASTRGADRSDFLNEIDILKKIFQGGSNPYVVTLVGCVTIQEPICLVTALVTNGDLLNYLKYIREKVMNEQDSQVMNESLEQEDNSSRKKTMLTSGGKNAYETLEEFSASDLLSFAYQIAAGMAHISSLGIIHRDLACRNILMGEGKSLKISDFGMSRKVESDQVYVKKSKGRLPWKWMAIEAIANREFTSASDVWSYGVTLWEISTLGGFPYPTISNDDLLEHLMKGGRLVKPSNCANELWEIVKLCWMKDPSERLTFSEIHTKLDILVSAQHSSTYIDLNINFLEPYYQTIDDDMFINLSDDEGKDEEDTADQYNHLAVVVDDNSTVQGKSNTQEMDSVTV